nr:myosin-3-like [Penaeus vannamei]
MVTATLNPPWGQTCSRPSYESGVISTQEHFRGFSGISYRCFIGKEQREAMTETGEKEEEARSDAPVSVATSHAEGDETVTVEELEEQLKASQKETAKAREEISTLQQQLATSVPRAEALLARRDLERRIDTLVRDNQALTDSVEHEQREREWLEGELRAQYEAAESSEQEMMNLQTFVRNLHSLVEEKTRVIEVQKDERESITKQLEEGKEEVLRLRKEAEGRMRTLSRLESLYKDSSSLAKTREEEVTRLQKETSMAKRQYDQLEKTVRRQDQNRADVEGQVQNLRGQLKVAEKQALTEGRQVQKITRKVEKIKRERDVLHRTYVKTLGTVQKHAGLVHIRELERQNAERELARIRRDLGKQDALITALQHARDRQVEETAVWSLAWWTWRPRWRPEGARCRGASTRRRSPGRTCSRPPRSPRPSRRTTSSSAGSSGMCRRRKRKSSRNPQGWLPGQEAPAEPQHSRHRHPEALLRDR